jgi:hypothetical protein
VAAQIESFGDAQHQHGEGGLTVSGIDFGTFPGRLWIFENADLSGASDEITPASAADWDDFEIRNVEIPAAPVVPDGTRYLVVEDAFAAFSFPFPFQLGIGVAPIITDFGDEQHDPGENGLIIDGSSLGASAGIARIYRFSNRTGAQDDLVVGGWTDVQLTGVDIPAVLNNTNGLRYLFVQDSIGRWSEAFSFQLGTPAVSTKTTLNWRGCRVGVRL